VNTNNTAVKRILREAREIMEAGPNPDFDARPLEDNLFEWHFTIRGPPGTAFEGGRYHGRICLPNEYPFKPPSIALLNASGRFEVGKKICLSVSAHHPEHWQPAWGLRTIITALIAFFPSKADGALAGLDYSDDERRKLASASRGWHCPRCELAMADSLPEDDGSHDSKPLPPPPPELTFAHEAQRAPAASPASLSASSGVCQPCVPLATPAAAPADADGGGNGEGERSGGQDGVGVASAEEDASSDASVAPRPPTDAAAAAPATATPATATPATATLAADSQQPSISPSSAGGRGEAVATPDAAWTSPTSAARTDWLGVLAACLAGLIAMLVTRKLMDAGDAEADG